MFVVLDIITRSGVGFAVVVVVVVVGGAQWVARTWSVGFLSARGEKGRKKKGGKRKEEKKRADGEDSGTATWMSYHIISSCDTMERWIPLLRLWLDHGRGFYRTALE